jgi:hypothetical protein
MSIQSRIYASGAFAFGEQGAVNDFLAAGYSTIIVWSVHVNSSGALILNDTEFVANGVYAEAAPMNLPARLASLYKAGIQIIFSVGAGGTTDFTTIGTLMNGSVPTAGNPLYDNFKALKDAMVSAGADINAIDFDNEEIISGVNSAEMAQIMINFGCMLKNIGYSSVTFCPYFTDSAWTDSYQQLMAINGNGFVSAIHLQCYSGGSFSNPEDWGSMIATNKGNTLLIPGLATNQANPGPWWDGDTNQPGGSVVTTDSVAMYGQGDWSGMLRKGNYASADIAMQPYNKGGGIYGGETFFFYCDGYLDLGPGKQFQPGDAVFFGGKPWWGSAPQCTGYSLSGGCSDIYNPSPTGGACPSNLQQQYATWNKGQYPINGGFIWLYDSIVNCVLSNCCGEQGDTTAQVATAYQQAIVNGLS